MRESDVVEVLAMSFFIKLYDHDTFTLEVFYLSDKPTKGIMFDNQAMRLGHFHNLLPTE